MSLTTYAGLQAAVLAWAERTGDTAASDKLADCVVLCEARVNQTPNLRVREMETEPAAITLTSGSGALPTDFLAMKDVTANTSSPIGLDYTDPGTYKREIAAFGGTEDAYSFYTIIGSTVRSAASATLGIIYYAKVPPLATATNWLLTKAPNVYLYGTLLELAIALEHVEGIDRWGPLYSGAINGLVGSETFSRGSSMAKRANGPSP